MTRIYVDNIKHLEIFSKKNKTKRIFHRTEEHIDSLLFMYVNSKGKQGETFYVSESVAEEVVNEAIADTKNYSITIKFQ